MSSWVLHWHQITHLLKGSGKLFTDLVILLTNVRSQPDIVQSICIKPRAILRNCSIEVIIGYRKEILANTSWYIHVYIYIYILGMNVILQMTCYVAVIGNVFMLARHRTYRTVDMYTGKPLLSGGIQFPNNLLDCKRIFSTLFLLNIYLWCHDGTLAQPYNAKIGMGKVWIIRRAAIAMNIFHTALADICGTNL